MKRNIFVTKDVRNEKEKNTNFPKFLLRLLEDHYETVGRREPEEWAKLDYLHKKIKRLKYRSCNKNVSSYFSM